MVSFQANVNKTVIPVSQEVASCFILFLAIPFLPPAVSGGFLGANSKKRTPGTRGAGLGVRDRTGVSTASDSRWERRGISKMLFVSKYPANLRPVVSELLFPLVNPLHWREHVFSRTPRESETEPVGTGDVVRSSRERSPQPLAPRCLTSTSRAAVSQLWHLK